MFLRPGVDGRQTMIPRRNDAPGETMRQLTIAQTLPITVPGTQVGIHGLRDADLAQQAECDGQIINPFRFNLNPRVWHSIPQAS